MEETNSVSNPERAQSGKQKTPHLPHHIPSTHASHADRQTLVVVGTETAVFDKASKVRKRILASFENFERVHIIVMCRRGFSEEHVDERVRIYPTNSLARPLRIFDAIRMGRALSRVDIVTAQDPFESGLAASFIARMKRAVFHVQVHTDFLSPAYARLSLLNRARVMLAGFVLNRTDHIRVVSERIRASLQKSYHLRACVSVLPIFVDVARFKNTEHSPLLLERFGKFSWKVLIVARLEPEKNVALAIRALAQSAPKDACLIIVGGGRELSLLQSFAKNCNSEGRVFFEGRREAAPYYVLSDLVLVPSKYEGYGMVIVEALAAGKPVLATDVGIAREAGAIVTTEEHFADALTQWFKNGPRTGELENYPYKSFEEYIHAYSEDIGACPVHTK